MSAWSLNGDLPWPSRGGTWTMDDEMMDPDFDDVSPWDIPDVGLEEDAA